MFQANNSSKSRSLQGHLTKFIYLISVFFAIILGFDNPLSAQSYRYMDSSGNLHFVDRPEKVPPQYRDQIPSLVTPIVVLDKKQARAVEQEKNKKKKELEKKKQQEEKKKQQALDKKRKQHEKEMRKKKKKKMNGEQMPDEAQEGDFSQVPESQQTKEEPAE